ncbi:MAG: ATP phosphoribosyltransferase regulatory subunit [Candidatus Tectomicrobia bacterium]|uniref:ATP phosphoribosyltransferase regulatory subunit n=1 Tax=Tectimicrobiota bacterium TaxID=2528274 RepID=A0A932HYC2_UNCTE|nr:ATP phosphoribosyltransferase regulatory subunit [Candidatus Tectomicrobia bacterium]
MTPNSSASNKKSGSGESLRGTERILAYKAMPAGSKVFLPEQARRKRLLEERLLAVFGRWGFSEIVTPVFEFYVPSPAGEGRDAETFRQVDRESGELLALRADMTPQIARVAGTLLADQPRPLRLCYMTNVFRHAHVAGLLQREFWQAGVELIGLISLEADAETIAIAVECLRTAGVENFRISLSHTAYLRGILDALGLEGARRREVLDAVARRDAAGLDALLRGLPGKREDARRLLDLPSLFGGKEVLDRAAKGVRNASSRRALRELARVLRLLDFYGLADRVLLDLSDFRDFDYYTGVIFEGFVEGSGYPICGGGRYDRLLGLYGTDGHGTGFALDLDQLLRIATLNGSEPGGADFLVIDFTQEKRIGVTLARDLRARGWRVARDIIRRDLAASLDYARRAGVHRCVVVDAQESRTGRVRLLDSSGKELDRCKASELAARIGERDREERS